MPELAAHKHSLSQTEIIIGKSYLDLLEAAALSEYTGDERGEDLEGEDPEFSSTVSSCAASAISNEVLEIERQRAEEQLQEIINNKYMVDIFIEDPESSDGGFWTSRLPKLGDIVTVTRTFARRLTVQEPCDLRESTNEMREVNTPDVNPLTPLGWTEDDYALRITLYDVIENLQPKLTEPKPYTLQCLSWLGDYESREDVERVAHYSLKALAMAHSHDMEPRDFLIALAKDRAQRFRRYTSAQWEAFTREIYVIYEEKYSRLIQDHSMWWVEAWQELTTEDDGPGNIAMFDIINEFHEERRMLKKKALL